MSVGDVADGVDVGNVAGDVTDCADVAVDDVAADDVADCADVGNVADCVDIGNVVVDDVADDDVSDGVDVGNIVGDVADCADELITGNAEVVVDVSIVVDERARAGVEGDSAFGFFTGKYDLMLLLGRFCCSMTLFFGNQFDSIV